MDPHNQVRKTGQAFHKQFHKGSMHMNHSFEVIWPINWESGYGFQYIVTKE